MRFDHIIREEKITRREYDGCPVCVCGSRDFSVVDPIRGIGGRVVGFGDCEEWNPDNHLYYGCHQCNAVYDAATDEIVGKCEWGRGRPLGEDTEPMGRAYWAPDSYGGYGLVCVCGEMVSFCATREDGIGGRDIWAVPPKHEYAGSASAYGCRSCGRIYDSSETHREIGRAALAESQSHTTHQRLHADPCECGSIWWEYAHITQGIGNRMIYEPCPIRTWREGDCEIPDSHHSWVCAKCEAPEETRGDSLVRQRDRRELRQAPPGH